jgi:hypothetical protein
MRALNLGLLVGIFLFPFVASTDVGWAQASRNLQKRIPKSDHTEYDSVRDAQQWKNPYLIVRPEGIEIIGVTPIGQGLAVATVSGLLEKLPDSAWPYGLVAAVQDLGLRSGKTDSARIEANRIKLLDLLKELGITVERWPSA